MQVAYVRPVWVEKDGLVDMPLDDCSTEFIKLVDKINGRLLTDSELNHYMKELEQCPSTP